MHRSCTENKMPSCTEKQKHLFKAFKQGFAGTSNKTWHPQITCVMTTLFNLSRLNVYKQMDAPVMT